MGLLAAAARIVELAGAPERGASVARLRADFVARTGAFAPDDPWFEERSRTFWCDAVTSGRFGREVAASLSDEERACLAPLERAHRGLFRADGDLLVDVWSGAELLVTAADDASRAELDASTGQLFDGRVAGTDAPYCVALLPGAAFHSQEATPHIEPLLRAARSQRLSTTQVLDALLRMQRSLRALSRVKPAYAYRIEALAPPSALAVRRPQKAPT
jgi:hypothetical protein